MAHLHKGTTHCFAQILDDRLKTIAPKALLCSDKGSIVQLSLIACSASMSGKVIAEIRTKLWSHQPNGCNA